MAVIERHHRTKKDAPSGTALRLAEFRASGPRRRLPSFTRQSPPCRDQHAFASCRRLPGEHTVVLALPGETIELSHRALNRDGFATRRTDAAKFLAGKPAGLYSMENVLGC